MAQLEKHVALLVGDTGVSPHDLERALALLRDAAPKESPDDLPSFRLQDTNLSALGLTPLAKKQVRSRAPPSPQPRPVARPRCPPARAEPTRHTRRRGRTRATRPREHWCLTAKRACARNVGTP